MIMVTFHLSGIISEILEIEKAEVFFTYHFVYSELREGVFGGVRNGESSHA